MFSMHKEVTGYMYLQKQVGIQLALPIQFPSGWMFSFWGMVPYNKFALYVRNQYERLCGF